MGSSVWRGGRASIDLGFSPMTRVTPYFFAREFVLKGSAQLRETLSGPRTKLVGVAIKFSTRSIGAATSIEKQNCFTELANLQLIAGKCQLASFTITGYIVSNSIQKYIKFLCFAGYL